MKKREPDKFFHVILNSIADGVFTTDHEGKITFINKAAEEITGFSFLPLPAASFLEIQMGPLLFLRNGDAVPGPFWIDTPYLPSLSRCGPGHVLL